jgi:hypothetical protein
VDQNRTVDVATLLQSIAGQLGESRTVLNQLSGAGGQGTHGERMANAFRAAADAAQNAGTDDAGQQLERAAEAMRSKGNGVAAGYYADGLAEAAQQFRGQSGISMDNIAPFLQSFLGGVERNNPARPGQGNMLDALTPAVTAMNQAQQSGGGGQQALMAALLGSMSGAQQTANMGNSQRVDPGAASATGVIGGIVAALAPQLLNMLMNRVMQGSGAQSQGQGSYPGGYAQPGAGAGAGGLGDLLGQLFSPGAQPQSQGADPMGGLGGLLGGLLGGAQGQGTGGYGGQQAQPNDPMGGLGGLLGGLLGGADGGRSPQSGSRGFRGDLDVDLSQDDNSRGNSQSQSW